MNSYIRCYTLDWKNEESDSLHLEYSYDKENWYTLNGNNGVLFTKLFSKRMSRPVILKSNDGRFKLIAKDAVEDRYVAFDSEDMMNFTDEREDDGADYNRASDVIEISDEILRGLQKRWGAPEPAVYVGNEEIKVCCNAGEEVALPKIVKLNYDIAVSKYKQVEWDKVDTTTPGTYEVEGTAIERFYTNPLIYHRADPFIYRHTDGYYYFTGSHTDAKHNHDGKYQYLKVILRRAKTIEGLADDSTEYEERVVYEREPVQGKGSPHIWAPEVHFIDGAWYIYYTVTTDPVDTWLIRPHVLRCEAANPMEGDWENLGRMQKENENDTAFTQFSLDHTSFEHRGERYFLWAEKPDNLTSNIYIAKMKNPYTICTDAVAIATPEYNWELHGFAVNEGASIIKRNGKIFMVFSASGTDAMYCLGLLTADEDADLLDSSSWKKTPYPILQSSKKNGQFGPGHNSFTVAEDGVTDLLVYHARQEERYLIDPEYAPLYDAGRNASVMEIYWNEDGTPNFTVPVPSGKYHEEKLKVKATVVVK